MTVVYIAGLFHSGSTMTSRLLNEHSEVFSAGEILTFHEAFEQPEDPETINCSCGYRDVRNCEFWSDLLPTVEEEITEDVWKICKTDKNYKKSKLKSVFGFYPESNGSDFTEMNRELFDLIRDKSDSSIVVDASKKIWRLIPLSRNMGDELRILHVIKEPENQIGSHFKRKIDSFFRSAIIKYGRLNYMIESIFDEDDRYMKLRFEDLANDFEATMRTIHNWLDIEYENPLDGPDSPWHHLGGSNVEVTKPDPERIQKDVDLNTPQQLVVKGLKKLY